jgi:hypothetical protein
VHTLFANSPTCVLACGRNTISTPVVNDAGSVASWKDLDFSFSFEKKSCLVISKDITIGVCNFSRVKLLNGKPSREATMVVSVDVLCIDSV